MQGASRYCSKQIMFMCSGISTGAGMRAEVESWQKQIYIYIYERNQESIHVTEFWIKIIEIIYIVTFYCLIWFQRGYFGHAFENGLEWSGMQNLKMAPGITTHWCTCPYIIPSVWVQAEPWFLGNNWMQWRVQNVPGVRDDKEQREHLSGFKEIKLPCQRLSEGVSGQIRGSNL